MKKWGIGILIVIVIAGLYFIEFSKVNKDTSATVPTLDELQFDEVKGNWDDFYRVRAEIIDGQSAEFTIPESLRKKAGKSLDLMGAAVFFSPGCRKVGDKIAVHSLFLYPTLGFANACEVLPEVAMRWTIRVNLEEDWILTREEMIQAMVNVQGTFRIDTEKPYESAFFLDNAKVKLIQEEETVN